MNILCIFGSRGIDDKEHIFNELDLLFKQQLPDEVVSGGAKGVDTIARLWSETRGIKFTEFPADWQAHGKPAGMIRNKRMAEYATNFVGFWDGHSVGTKGMIDIIQRSGKEWTTITLEGGFRIVDSFRKMIKE